MPEPVDKLAKSFGPNGIQVLIRSEGSEVLCLHHSFLSEDIQPIVVVCIRMRSKHFRDIEPKFRTQAVLNSRIQKHLFLRGLSAWQFIKVLSRRTIFISISYARTFSTEASQKLDAISNIVCTAKGVNRHGLK